MVSAPSNGGGGGGGVKGERGTSCRDGLISLASCSGGGGGGGLAAATAVLLCDHAI